MMIAISLLIFRHLIKPLIPQDLEEGEKPLITRIFKKVISSPKLKVKEVAPEKKIGYH